MSFASLADAIDWAAQRWDGQRTPPIRLHRAHATDGALGAPAFTVAFAMALDESAHATTRASRTVACHHPMLVTRNAHDCPECYGLGVKDVRVERYRYPMTIALCRLSNTLRPRRQPHPFLLVLTLATHDWDWHVASRTLEVHPDPGEALFLRALRQLHGRYEEGPIGRISWLDKSESQQRAETLAL